MADEQGEQPRPTEETPKGLTVPVPKRGEFFASLRRIAKVGKDSAASSGPQK